MVQIVDRNGSVVEVCVDVTEMFDLLDEHLIYIDSPIEGFMRLRKTDELFAFRCMTIIRDTLWHWVLLSASSTERNVKDWFEDAKRSVPPYWVSIVEDRRGGEPRLYVATLVGAIHQLPNKVFEWP